MTTSISAKIMLTACLYLKCISNKSHAIEYTQRLKKKSAEMIQSEDSHLKTALFNQLLKDNHVIL